MSPMSLHAALGLPPIGIKAKYEKQPQIKSTNSVWVGGWAPTHLLAILCVTVGNWSINWLNNMHLHHPKKSTSSPGLHAEARMCKCSAMYDPFHCTSEISWLPPSPLRFIVNRWAMPTVIIPSLGYVHCLRPDKDWVMVVNLCGRA